MTTRANRTASGFDMRLSRLPIYTPYVDNSYTKVKLAPGLCGKVTFEPWPEFNDIVQNTKRVIDEFPPCVTAEAEDIFGVVRKALDPTSSEHHQERQRWFELRRAQKLREAQKSVEYGLNTPVQASREPSSDATAEKGCTSSVNTLENADRQKDTSRVSKKGSGTTAYTNSKSCAFLFESVFKISQHLIRGLRMSEDFFILPELTLNSEIARGYDASTGPADYCTLTPDRALTTEQERPATTLPVCSFELKGPLREFWKASNHPLANAKTKRPTKKQRVDHDGNLDTDVDAVAEHEAHDEFPKVGTISRTEDAYNYSAEGLAEFYNDLFRNSSILSSEGSRKLYYFAFLPVAQALSQALLSDSGCCALYNFQEAVAFQVRKQDDRDTSQVGEQNKVPSLRVKVSRAFPCDEQPGNICALIALADYRCEEVNKDKMRKMEIRDLFNEVTDAFVNWKLKEKGDKKSASSEQQETGSDKEGRNKESDASSKAKQSATDAVYRYSTDTSSSCSGASADGSTSSNIMTEEDDLIFTKALTKIIRSNDGVVGNGGSAVVIGGTYEGHKVAIKSWNGVSEDGIQCLLNEIQVYRALTEQHARVLGVGIPGMRMSRMIPAQDAVLVIDYVGKGIHRRVDGSLVLRDIDINLNREQENGIEVGDMEDICHAAIKSLRLLHESGVLHGDIALRNLRVQQEKAVTRKSSWRAWWIDLGLSRPRGMTRLEMEVELEQCARLFPEADVDLIISAE